MRPNPSYSRLVLLTLCLAAGLMSGCSSVLHELQPHRLWRLNYQEPLGRTESGYFSVDDTGAGAGNPSVSHRAAGRPEESEISCPSGL